VRMRCLWSWRFRFDERVFHSTNGPVGWRAVMQKRLSWHFPSIDDVNCYNMDDPDADTRM
jgi:hypothetical protein